MPNDCMNWVSIKIKSDKELFDRIKKNLENEENPTLFSTLYPEPDYDKVDVIEAFGTKIVKDKSQAWYDWRITNWGTKWELYDLYDIQYDEDTIHTPDGSFKEYEISFPFATAWSPPTAWYDYVTANYSNISIDANYEEFGCCFAGEYRSEYGSVGTDTCVSWDSIEDMERIVRERKDDLPDVVNTLENELEYLKEREAEGE